jgi:hypothetical protein
VTTPSIRVVIHKEDARRLGVERNAEYRHARKGEWFVKIPEGLDKWENQSPSSLHYLVAKRSDYLLAEQLLKGGWVCSVKGAVRVTFRRDATDVFIANLSDPNKTDLPTRVELRRETNAAVEAALKDLETVSIGIATNGSPVVPK